MHVRTSSQPALDLGFSGYTCNWGAHLCGLYETDKERDEIVFGFLARGCTAGDLQLFCPVERTVDEFRREMGSQHPECESQLDNADIIQFLDAKDLYYPTGIFSPRAMDQGLEDFFERSQLHGPRNIRASAEMSWALQAIPGAELLMVYESRLNYFIPRHPWISICMYDLRKFSGAAIMGVLRTHPFVISGGIVTENPYYQDPDAWLAANAPEYRRDVC